MAIPSDPDDKIIPGSERRIPQKLCANPKCKRRWPDNAEKCKRCGSEKFMVWMDTP